MPPARTLPPAKAVMKTERTHEENQERAYIAASRRSDRSLEARVESARRASEIHKRRTGRSLRVTEQDVINEEMYEEEDDDLPLAYRRLTAHLQTNSADFNQRLNAYITNQVAMRTALQRSIAITNMNGGASFLNNSNSQFGPSMSSMFPSPMLAHQNPSDKPAASPSSATASYRQAPYPSPRPPQQSHDSDPGKQQEQQRLDHRRANSIAIPPQSQVDATVSPVTGNDERRMSLPIKTEHAGLSASTPSTPITDIPDTAKSQRHRPSFDAGTFSKLNQTFTMALPAESQMLLGSGFANSQDPMMANLMAGSNNFPKAEDYDYKSPSGNHGTTSHNSNAAARSGGKQTSSISGSSRDVGLDMTLAPSAYNDNSAPTWPYGNMGDYSSQNMTSLDELGNLLVTSAGNTPNVGGDGWGDFIDTSQWDLPDTAGETNGPM